MSEPTSSTNLPEDIDLNSSDVPEALCCPVCFNIYNEPKLLKCGHTFCFKCIKRLANMAYESHDGGLNIPQFSCPECRQATAASTHLRLSTNYRLADVIAQFKRMKSGKSKEEVVNVIKCKNCSESVKNESAFCCTTCPVVGAEDNYFCATCSVMKHNGHHLIPIQDLTTTLERQESTSTILTHLRQIGTNYEQNSMGSDVNNAKTDLLDVVRQSIDFLGQASGVERIPTNAKVTKEGLKKCQNAYNVLISEYSDVMMSIKRLDEDYIQKLENLKNQYRTKFFDNIAPFYPDHLPTNQLAPAFAPAVDNPFLYNRISQRPLRKIPKRLMHSRSQFGLANRSSPGFYEVRAVEENQADDEEDL